MELFNMLKKRDEFIDLLIANEGTYVYYIEFTNELKLSTKKYPSGSLLLILDKKTELNLGPVTYVGKL